MIDKGVELKILVKFNVSKADLIGWGTEAQVYRCHDNKVLKIYNELSDINKQKILKRFYETIDSGNVSYGLPHIYEVIEDSGTLITIEKLMKGSNLQEVMKRFDEEQLNKLMKTYLSASLELKNVKTNSAFTGYKLFNDYCFNSSERKDWNSFLKYFLNGRQEELYDYFSKDVIDYDTKLELLQGMLSLKYSGEYSLIHGDFYPGNLLVDEEGEITGLIDFGIMTMYGDYLFDIATSWVFFDMYDNLNANLLDRYLSVIIEELGEEIKKKLYLYVLVYSIISANFYSNNCRDGHYQWCVRNLNNEVLWNELT